MSDIARCLLILGLALGLITLLIKLFPSLKKPNWKIMAGIYFIIELFDFYSTYLCFAKYKNYDAEFNIIFRAFYKMGIGGLGALILTGAIIVLIGLVSIRILLSKKLNLYFYALMFPVIELIVAVNNYLLYFAIIG